MGASYWYLFFGAVFCCTGIGLPVGIFMIIYWFYKDFMDKGVTVNHVQANREEPGQEDQTFSGNFGTDNDYKFKGNIGDLRNREQYT